MNNYNDFNKSYNNTSDNNLLQNLSNENFINMANKIDNIPLNNLSGTNLMELNNSNNNSSYSNNQSGSIPNIYQNLQNIQNSTQQMSQMSQIPQMQNPNEQYPNSMQTMSNMYGSSSGSAQFENQEPDGNKNKSLIKSITKELINNLKENNISLRDENSTINSLNSSNSSKPIIISKNKSKSKKKYTQSDVFDNNIDDLEDLDDYTDYEEANKADKTKSNKSVKTNDYKQIIKKNVENMMSQNNIPESSSLTSYIFDDLFNIKDFAILFGVYFLLSQEMIKDLFSQYFTSLNPDDSGKVGVRGVIIYGLILTVLYMVLKKLI